MKRCFIFVLMLMITLCVQGALAEAFTSDSRFEVLGCEYYIDEDSGTAEGYAEVRNCSDKTLRVYYATIRMYDETGKLIEEGGYATPYPTVLDPGDNCCIIDWRYDVPYNRDDIARYEITFEAYDEFGKHVMYVDEIGLSTRDDEFVFDISNQTGETIHGMGVVAVFRDPAGKIVFMCCNEIPETVGLCDGGEMEFSFITDDEIWSRISGELQVSAAGYYYVEN